jgi:hypothetical protein
LESKQIELLRTLVPTATKIGTAQSKQPKCLSAISALEQLEMMRDYVAAFHPGLADQGFAEGRNIGIEAA